MAGRGFAPNPDGKRQNKYDKPIHGWKAVPQPWPESDRPKPPSDILKASREAWATWFSSWYSGHWRPEDVPALRQLIRLYDRVERGEFQRSAELRMGMDTWGITPKGQMALRWQRPESDAVEDGDEIKTRPAVEVDERRRTLKVV